MTKWSIYRVCPVDQAKLSTCQRWRSRVLNLPGFLVPPGVFIPDCAQNGSFRTEQCSGSTGLCWCVTKDGFMIWTTTTRGTPNCIKKGRYMYKTDSGNLPSLASKHPQSKMGKTDQYYHLHGVAIVLVLRRKPDNPEKLNPGSRDENQQQTWPTYDVSSRICVRAP